MLYVLAALSGYVALSILLFFREPLSWTFALMFFHTLCLCVVVGRGVRLRNLYRVYVLAYPGDKYILTFKSFLLARDVNVSHRRVNLAKRQELRAQYGIVKRKSKPVLTSTVFTPYVEPELTTEERHRQKLNELASELRIITPLEHEEISESIINDAMALPFEEGRVLLVNSYKIQRERNRKLATIPDEDEVPVH